MKRVTIIAGLGLLILAGQVQAQKQFEFRAGPVMGMSFGDTRFKIDIESEIDNVTYGLGSELIYPLDMTRAGGNSAFG